jgi:hypothetical protein
MEKVCRVLYKHADLKACIAFEVYLCKQCFMENYYQAYWVGPLNKVLFHETDKRLESLRRKMGDYVEQLGYCFLFEEHLN